MWKFGFVVLFMSWSASGQEQFLREVTNPSGPSQVILRGGSLNSNGNGEELQQIPPLSDQGGQQVEERYVVTDDPAHAVPFQSPQETPIPEDGGENNPFTNGENGFGLRLSEQAPISPPNQVQQVQAARPPQSPQLFQPPGAPVFQQVQQPVEINQPAPIIHQTEISLPQLPPGQQYVDVYGRPINLEGQQPPQVLQQVAPPTAPPTAPPAPQIQTLPPAPQQVLVDQYGRQLSPIENQSHFLTQHHFLQPAQVLQPAPVPVLTPTTVQHLVQPASVVKQKLSPLTLQTYAVPAVRKVGNLVIPYAQKIQFAKTLDQAGVIFPPTVPAPAAVRSRHRTVFTPTNLLTQAVQEVHHVAPVVQEVHALPAPVPVVNLSYPAAPQVELHHHPAVHAPGQVLLQHPEQIALAHQPQQLVHFAEQPPPQFLHHHPQQLVHFSGQPQLLHHPHQPHQLVQIGQHLAPTVPLASPVLEHHVHHQPQAVLPLASPVLEHHIHHQPHSVVPAVHVEKHLVPAVPAPVLVKKVKPIVAKAIVPEVTLIHQPVLSKVLFQRHIFNVKHGSEPIIYQDLCTVYPFQKNLRACVLKKATLPELHHPDVRTINVEYSQPQTDQSIIAAGSPILGPAPPSSSPSVTVAKALPQNIQDTIRRESARIKAAATKASIAAVASSAQPETAESRNSSSSRGKSRRKKNKGSTSRQTTTTEKPFKLA